MKVAEVHANEQLFDDAHLSKVLFQHASIAILITTEDGTIILANRFCNSLFGYKESELEGKPIETLIPERFRDKHRMYRAAYASHPVKRPMGMGRDLFGLKKDTTEFPVEVSLDSYNENGQSLMFAFISDITERKKGEQEIVRLNNELEDIVYKRTHMLQETLVELERSRQDLNSSLERERDLNKLKSKFVSVASHEFRTPLTAILSSTILLQKYTLTDQQPQRAKHISRIFSSINTLTCILNDFLSLGRIEEGRVVVNASPVNVHELINGIIEEVEQVKRHGQEFVFEYSGDDVFLIDPSLLKHIVINLLSNAIKYSDESSTIEVSAENAPGVLILKVRDHGIGIPLEDQSHLFEPFYRAQNAVGFQGTGLGLNIVAQYVRMMNGEITVNSEPSRGTEMVICFNG